MDSENSDSNGAPASWGQRHGLTIMLVVMGAMFALVMVVQAVT